MTIALVSRGRGMVLADAMLFIDSWVSFCQHHGRAPGRGDRDFNDFLFRVRVSGVLREPLRRRITDKMLAKQYVCARVGAGHVVPTLAVLASPDAVTGYQPDAFPVVLKPTHSSGRVLVAHTPEEHVAAHATLLSWLEHDYFRLTLEENYLGLEQRVMVEPFIPSAYRLEGSIHCRQGVPKVVTLIDRFDPEKRRESFDIDYRALRVSLGFPYHPLKLDKPVFWDDLLAKAGLLAREFAYIRVDFYASDDHFLFGELTNLPAGALGRFSSADGQARFSAAFFKE